METTTTTTPSKRRRVEVSKTVQERALAPLLSAVMPYSSSSLSSWLEQQHGARWGHACLDAEAGVRLLGLLEVQFGVRMEEAQLGRVVGHVMGFVLGTKGERASALEDSLLEERAQRDLLRRQADALRAFVRLLVDFCEAESAWSLSWISKANFFKEIHKCLVAQIQKIIHAFTPDIDGVLESFDFVMMNALLEIADLSIRILRRTFGEPASSKTSKEEKNTSSVHKTLHTLVLQCDDVLFPNSGQDLLHLILWTIRTIHFECRDSGLNKNLEAEINCFSVRISHFSSELLSLLIQSISPLAQEISQHEIDLLEKLLNEKVLSSQPGASLVTPFEGSQVRDLCRCHDINDLAKNYGIVLNLLFLWSSSLDTEQGQLIDFGEPSSKVNYWRLVRLSEAEVPPAEAEFKLLPLSPGETKFTIGRKRDCNFRILDEDLLVSRYHSEIIVRDAGSKIFVKDLDSANGVEVDEEKIEPRKEIPIKAGSKILFGPNPKKGKSKLIGYLYVLEYVQA